MRTLRMALVGGFAGALMAGNIATLCLSEIKLAHTDDEVRREMT
jgi:hypothetical protein